jgi:Protein of unknown function (DUF2934)
MMSHAPITSREESIRQLAHKFWEEEGRPDGRAEAHWLRAVAEVNIPHLSLVSSDNDVKPAKKAKTKR